MSMTRTLYSLSALSTELSKDRRTIARALTSVPPDGKVSGHAAWHMLTALQALGWIGHKSDGERLDAEQERARKDRAIADLHEMKLAILRKKDVETEGITRVMTQVFAMVRTRFLAFPSKLTPFLVGQTEPGEVFRILQDAVYDLLNDLADTHIVAAVEGAEVEG